MSVSTPSSRSSLSGGSDYVFVGMERNEAVEEALPLSSLGNRRKCNVFRMWKSLSRFQRNLLWACFAICVCTALYITVTFRRMTATDESDFDANGNNANGDAASRRVKAGLGREAIALQKRPPPEEPSTDRKVTARLSQRPSRRPHRGERLLIPPDGKGENNAKEIIDDEVISNTSNSKRYNAGGAAIEKEDVPADDDSDAIDKQKLASLANVTKTVSVAAYDEFANAQKPVLAQPSIPKFKGPQNKRQEAVVAAFKHAWRGYKQYAWGHDHLKPISGSYHDWFGVGLTILDNLDSLIIMGLDEEFAEAKKWVEEKLSFGVDRFVSLFETTIRCLGGLLSAFHLSGERVFLEKAQDLGDRLIAGFDTPIRKVPFSDVNLESKTAKSPPWSPESSLAEVATIQLEFRDLSRATGNPIYEQLAFNTSLHLHNDGCNKFDGLCPMFISPKTGEFKSGYTITMGARTDSYYEYLLKQWLQTGKTIDWLRDDFSKAMQGMQKYLLRYSEPNKLTFIGELIGEKTFSPKMDHLVCYIAGTLALGVLNGLPRDQLDLAKQLTHTCNQMYATTATRLAPEIAHFNLIPGTKTADIQIKPLDAHYLLRPETVESFFYLFRVTGEKQYQDFGWDVFEAIEKYAKLPNGYASIQSVKKIPVQRKDMMESFFLAETLKYLYLLFADDPSELSLHEYVFNTEAHPLPIYKS